VLLATSIVGLAGGALLPEKLGWRKRQP